MAHFPKPAEGSWTEHFGLATTPSSYDDSISPEHYQREQQAIFKQISAITNAAVDKTSLWTTQALSFKSKCLQGPIVPKNTTA